MGTYAAVLSLAIPGFVLLIIIEELVARRMGKNINNAMDLISSLSSGMTNTLKSLVGLTVVIISYEWMVEHIALYEIESTIWMYVWAFIGLDFVGYWSHRWNHHINLFWNRHIVHHSSEEFNLACALRQSISAIVSIYFFLYIPMALIGVPAEVVIIVAPLHLFAQFWYHTRLINRMGFLEHILVTPSHHRVHHAINDEYLDRNFAQIFIVWDKWFGTFQEELPEIEAVYGTKRPAQTWNPIIINFMHLWALIQDAWRTESWWDKCRLWFMPTGWRPADVEKKYPISYYKKASEQIKYHSNPSKAMTFWAWSQLLITNGLVYYLMINLADFSFPYLLSYFAFMMLTIFAFTSLMDRHIIALPFTVLSVVFGFSLIYFTGGWFGLEKLFAGASFLMAFYLLFSLFMTWYLLMKEPQSVSLTAS